MARNFLSFPFAPYAGKYSSKAFNNSRGNQKGLMVGLNIQWALYQANGQALGAANPNFAVSANLNSAGPNTVAAGWTIESVYIDNENVNFPVYVYFPSTGFAISCPQNSAGWYQVFTNDRNALISGIGIPNSDIANAAQTNVFFTDAAMVPYLDQELPTSIPLLLSSPSISRGNLSTPGYASPALGDQVTSSQIDLSQINNTAQLFVPQASGFRYITYLEIRAVNLSGGQEGLCSLLDVTSNRTIVFAFFNGVAGFVAPDLLRLHNCNIKIDATHSYVFKTNNVVTGGFAQIYCCYSESQI